MGEVSDKAPTSDVSIVWAMTNPSTTPPMVDIREDRKR
jgi:hypothetical protein